MRSFERGLFASDLDIGDILTNITLESSVLVLSADLDTGVSVLSLRQRGHR
jgi:hypothetical protein